MEINKIINKIGFWGALIVLNIISHSSYTSVYDAINVIMMITILLICFIKSIEYLGK